MAKYDFRVDTYEIDPPLENNIGWGAKARVKEVGTGRSDDGVVLHEHWGSTEEEAEAKARAEAEEWIRQQA